MLTLAGATICIIGKCIISINELMKRKEYLAAPFMNTFRSRLRPIIHKRVSWAESLADCKFVIAVDGGTWTVSIFSIL